MTESFELTEYIRDIPDYPVAGVNFKDITPLLQNPDALQLAVSKIVGLCEDQHFDIVAAPDARGFIFGVPIALALNCGFVPIRKAGKLPHDTACVEYALEYGTDTLEIHMDAVKPGARVLLIDNLLATGGTIRACCQLLQQQQAVIGRCCFLVELGFLNGRDKLAAHDVQSVIQY